MKNAKTLFVTAFTALAIAGSLLSVNVKTSYAEEQKIRWKVQAVFPTWMPGLGDAIVDLAADLDKATDGNIKFKVFDSGKIVPSKDITEAVKDNKIPAGYAYFTYDQGKIPASTLLSAVPFGLEPVEYAAWWYYAGGEQLAQKVYKSYGLKVMLASIIGPETAGWYREEIKSLDDLKGLKIRFSGLGGDVLKKTGASVTLKMAEELYPALEKGELDATEYSSPAIDQRMGFHKIAKNNYFPGWHQTFTATHLVVNQKVWDGLTSSNKALIEMACTASTFKALTHGESLQGAILNGFPEKGVVVRQLSPEILAKLYELTSEVMMEKVASDAMFKEVYESQMAFKKEYQIWKENGYLPRNFK